MERNPLLLQKAKLVTAQVEQAVLGKEREIREVFLAGGHVLLTDIPGVGKTTLALAFSKALALECRRVQFTPDVMPSDLTGFSVYRREDSCFVYHPGSVFCNLLLADEINRTSPKTQSALLEVMEEGRVSVDGVTREVPKPFLVIATQNPAGSAGTQLLPEAQVDRFMITMTMGYPAFEDELQMALEAEAQGRFARVGCVMEKEELMTMQTEIHQVCLRENVARYIVRLVTATREHPYLEQGASPRATLALVKMAKAAAWYAGRMYVMPADVAEQFSYVLSHRVFPNAAARMEGHTREQILSDILRTEKRPPMEGRRQ